MRKKFSTEAQKKKKKKKQKKKNKTEKKQSGEKTNFDSFYFVPRFRRGLGEKVGSQYGLLVSVPTRLRRTSTRNYRHACANWTNRCNCCR